MKEKVYSIKEIYYTLQGEGANTGKPAVFCRFSGCNLWSGLEKDRSTAICQFCDTDFWGIDGELGGKYGAGDLAKTIKSLFDPDALEFLVVCTGGEPLLQLDQELVDALHDEGLFIAIETNGTLDPPEGIDWICMSPKANTHIVLTEGDEVKIVFPQENIHPKDFENMKFDHFFLQPMDGKNVEENVQHCIDYCLNHPRWRLSLQTHKLIGIQ